jgi:ribulose-phosphate 3-epimerase
MPFADDIDNILIMTVEPGFGGQKFMETMLPKISQTAKAIQNKNIRLEVDGGINLHTAAKCLQCGADVLVAGSAVFKAENPADVIRQFHNLGEKL